MKIGIFDSGIGGLSVLHKALKEMPQHQYIYYADTENAPYGEKSAEAIISLVDNIMDFMLSQQVEAVVIACNTATSVAVQGLRDRFDLPIIGMEPAVKKAADDYPDSRILVMATPVTVAGDKMRYLLEQVDSEHLVDLISMPGLVRFAENDVFEGEEVENYLRQQLKQFDFSQYNSLVLGCTHFNYFKEVLRKMIPQNVNFVDGIEGTVSQLSRKIRELLEENIKNTGNIGNSMYNSVGNSTNYDDRSNSNEQDTQVSYYISGRPASEEEIKKIRRLLNRLDIVENI